jgi:hypothetical protein
VQLWPVLAKWFDLEVGPSLRIPLTKFMPHHKDHWASIVEKHGLKDIPFEKVIIFAKLRPMHAGPGPPSHYSITAFVALQRLTRF